jgi:hypothetical protein
MATLSLLFIFGCFMAFYFYITRDVKKMKLGDCEFDHIENIWVIMKNDEQVTHIFEVDSQISIHQNSDKEVVAIKVSHPVMIRVKSKTGCGGELEKK